MSQGRLSHFYIKVLTALSLCMDICICTTCGYVHSIMNVYIYPENSTFSTLEKFILMSLVVTIWHDHLYSELF